MPAGFLWGSLWVHNGDTTSHQLPQSDITLSMEPVHVFLQYWHDMPLLRVCVCVCVCMKKWDPLETHSVISTNSYNCMHSANSCTQLQWHGKKDPTSDLKYKPVSVSACLSFAAYSFNAPDTIHHHCLSYTSSSTDGTHLPINFSDILPLWQIESPPSGHVSSDLAPGIPSFKLYWMMSVLVTHLLVATVLHKHMLIYLLSQTCSCAIYIAIEALWMSFSRACYIHIYIAGIPSKHLYLYSYANCMKSQT
jgi:hypothetical protein